LETLYYFSYDMFGLFLNTYHNEIRGTELICEFYQEATSPNLL